MEKMDERLITYFIASGGFIKIGKTTNFPSRLSTLQTGCPQKITVLSLLCGIEYPEEKMHIQFREYRTHGEWFIHHPKIVTFLATAKKIELCKPIHGKIAYQELHDDNSWKKVIGKELQYIDLIVGRVFRKESSPYCGIQLIKKRVAEKTIMVPFFVEMQLTTASIEAITNIAKIWDDRRHGRDTLIENVSRLKNRAYMEHLERR